MPIRGLWRTSGLQFGRLPAIVAMSQDKQLAGVDLADVLEKRRLDQALNAKQFAVLAGISHSTAREWFRLPGFPVIQGLVFWDDFVQWRRTKAGMNPLPEEDRELTQPIAGSQSASANLKLPPRAARLLTEAS